jgi:hypothetical protein
MKIPLRYQNGFWKIETGPTAQELPAKSLKPAISKAKFRYQGVPKRNGGQKVSNGYC